MLALLLLVSAEPQTAIDAERAFAADAQKIGQWAAFRKWAAADATMFTPRPARAQAWLKDRKEPAKAVEWWPTTSWVSCDGTLAVNTGGSKWPDGRHGYFTTVWQRQSDGGWKWVLDHGDGLSAPRPIIRPVAETRASCSRPIGQDPVQPTFPDGTKHGEIASKDGTLSIAWYVTPPGHRIVNARMAQAAKPGRLPPGIHLLPVLTNLVVAPTQ